MQAVRGFGRPMSSPQTGRVTQGLQQAQCSVGRAERNRAVGSALIPLDRLQLFEHTVASSQELLHLVAHVDQCSLKKLQMSKVPRGDLVWPNKGKHTL